VVEMLLVALGGQVGRSITATSGRRERRTAALALPWRSESASSSAPAAGRAMTDLAALRRAAGVCHSPGDNAPDVQRRPASAWTARTSDSRWSIATQYSGSVEIDVAPRALSPEADDASARWRSGAAAWPADTRERHGEGTRLADMENGPTVMEVIGDPAGAG